MRAKIRLDKYEDAVRLNQIAQGYPNSEIMLKDKSDKFIVNAKSLLGVLYSMEFSTIWLESDVDLYSKLSDLIVLE